MPPLQKKASQPDMKQKSLMNFFGKAPPTVNDTPAKKNVTKAVAPSASASSVATTRAFDVPATPASKIRRAISEVTTPGGYAETPPTSDPAEMEMDDEEDEEGIGAKVRFTYHCLLFLLAEREPKKRAVKRKIVIEDSDEDEPMLVKKAATASALS
jgi:DNA mismatch repair protein MSH6